MSSREQCPYHDDGRVVIGPEFKADAPARYARLRPSDPSTRPSSTGASRAGWSSGTTWPGRR